MARLPRASQGSIIYHVLNRGNARQRLFFGNLRGRPYGYEDWTKEISRMLGITQSFRNKGGQRKQLNLNLSEPGAEISIVGS